MESKDEIKQLYQEVILDHNKSPRNFKKLDDANRHSVGFNPLCGDKLDLYIKMNGDKIDSVGFLGSGCAISKSSASVMTTMVKGKTKEEAAHLFDIFSDMVTGKKILTPEEADDLGSLAAFSGVSEFPARVKCASLAWHTLKAALEGNEQQACTEKE